MAIVTKTIGGRAYRYEQHSQRVSGKVVTKSKYLGAVHPKRKGLTLGEIVKGLLQASAQSFAPKHEKKEHQSRARAPDARSQVAERERFIDACRVDIKAAYQRELAKAPKAQAPTVNVEEVQAWKDFGERVAAAQTAREAPAAEKASEASPPSTPSQDVSPSESEAPGTGGMT